VNKALKQRIRYAVKKRLNQANAKGYNLPSIPIKFDLKDDATLGMFYKFDDDSCEFSFNLKLAEENPEKFIEEVVPHEVAHYVQYEALKDESYHHHGKVWQDIMRDVFGMDKDSRCISHNEFVK
jgi:predicted SprT family Zn-dependent metalloprotease